MTKKTTRTASTASEGGGDGDGTPTTKATKSSSDKTITKKTTTKFRKRNLPSSIVHTYADYASRLWKETNHESRQRIENDKVAATIRELQHVLRASTSSSSSFLSKGATTRNSGDDRSSSSSSSTLFVYTDVVPEQIRIDLDKACEAALQAIQNKNRDREEQGNGTNESANGYHDGRKSADQSGPIALQPTTAKSNGIGTNGLQDGTVANGSLHLPTRRNESVGYRNGSANNNDTMSSEANLNSNGSSPAVLRVVSADTASVSVAGSVPSVLSHSNANTAIATSPAAASSIKKKKKTRSRRSIAFGALMGAVVTCWVFSGNYIFTGLFTLMTVLGQLEYYRMIMQTGIYPARRISVLGACSMFLTALIRPDLHQICLPIFGLWAMVGFLYFKKGVTTISEIATTFTGMFYLGYVPSFWVRIRLIGMNREPTRLAPIVGPILTFIGTTAKQQAESSTIIPTWLPQAVHLPITTGAVFIFWTWLCLAFSDVGAYFVGRNFGKTKLSVISPAAGATSPNKSIEGVVGGCTISAILAILGAWIQRWPFPILTGTVHGVLLGLLGLLGDLTASMIKRDAGVKDFGDLLPEHGGILDRVDSFIWAAPYSWLVCAYIIPGLKAMVLSAAKTVTR